MVMENRPGAGSVCVVLHRGPHWHGPVTTRIGGREAKPYQPAVAQASDEAERAIRSFRVPEG